MGKTAVTKQGQEKARKLRNWQIGRYSIISAIVERQPMSAYVNVTVVYRSETGQSDSDSWKSDCRVMIGVGVVENGLLVGTESMREAERVLGRNGVYVGDGYAGMDSRELRATFRKG